MGNYILFSTVCNQHIFVVDHFYFYFLSRMHWHNKMHLLAFYYVSSLQAMIL